MKYSPNIVVFSGLTGGTKSSFRGNGDSLTVAGNFIWILITAKTKYMYSVCFIQLMVNRIEG